jgi:hypothetical protein
MAAARQGEDPPAVPLLGQVVEGRYLSPDSSFRFTLPSGPADNPKVTDRAAGREFVMTLTDRYCRQVIIVETRGELGSQSLAGWVSARVTTAMDPQVVLDLERRSDTTRFGPTEWLAWTSPRYAPCEEVPVQEGRPGRRVRPDAEAALAVFAQPRRVYRVLYLVGRGAQGEVSNGIRRLPAARVLRELLEGFDPAP